MKDMQVSLNFTFNGESVDDAREKGGTDHEAELYADAFGIIFLKVIERFKSCGAHPEVLDAAIKRFRVDVGKTKEVLYASPRSAE